MARRNTTQASTTDAPEAEVTETETPETPQAEVTETETPEVEIDLTEFQAATAKALEERDQSTGQLPPTAIEPVNKVYRELEGIKPKNAAKNWVESQMLESVNDLDAVLARAYSDIRSNLSAAGGKSEKAPADPKAAFVNKLAAHSLAYQLVVTGAPEGVDADEAVAEVSKMLEGLSDEVSSYGTWNEADKETRGDAPTVSPIVRAAFKLSAGKASGGGRTSGASGVRRDVGKHIASAFADKESGAFLTVAEISNHTSEEYGDSHPSQGAVSARLFPSSGKCTVEGIVPQDKTDDTPRGAVKA